MLSAVVVMAQADPLVLEQVCTVIADEDIEVAAKASTVLEMVTFLCILSLNDVNCCSLTID
jgi:hypothetical protein